MHRKCAHRTWSRLRRFRQSMGAAPPRLDTSWPRLCRVLACARPALHRPALPCTPLHCALDMDSYCICRPPGGTMMAFGRAYSAT